AIKALDWLLTTEHPFIVYATTGVYFRNRTMKRYAMWEKWNQTAPEEYRFAMPTVEGGDLDRKNTTFIKILLTEANDEVYRQLMEAMGEDADKLNPVFSEPTLLDVNAAGVNKGKGVQRLAELFGFDPQNAMAIGDNFNDITLMQSVGLPVAPQNAEAQIKALARFITCSNDESPLTYAIAQLYPELLA
ncbi:MAG: HAD-IIB family hydrolase, partial [Oscillospiraceae bacterium]|nr:HAD-IIB family hydrolase [Oscillospiraceae bacterium]